VFERVANFDVKMFDCAPGGSEFTPVTIVVIAALLLLLLVSLATNAKQFFAKLDLSKQHDDLLMRLKCGRSGRIQEVTEMQLRDFHSTLQAYNVARPNAQDIEAVALREMVQDLRVLATITNYAQEGAWGHAFAVVIGIRVRLVVSQFVFEHVPSGSEPVRRGIEHLLVLLRAWAALAAFYDDFTQPRAFKAPGELAVKNWPDLPAAEAVARETRDAARALLALVEKAP
jgi:hypothetical protein